MKRAHSLCSSLYDMPPCDLGDSKVRSRRAQACQATDLALGRRGGCGFPTRLPQTEGAERHAPGAFPGGMLLMARGRLAAHLTATGFEAARSPCLAWNGVPNA